MSDSTRTSEQKSVSLDKGAKPAYTSPMLARLANANLLVKSGKLTTAVAEDHSKASSTEGPAS